MKIVSALLPLSLAANALLAWLVWHEPAPASVASVAPSPHSVATVSGTAAAPAAAAGEARAADPAALRDRLRALGLSEDEVRAAVRAQLEAPRLARQRELLGQAARATPWWQRGSAAPDFTREQNRELRALRNAERNELIKLFGPTGAVTPAETEAFAYLPPDKAARLAALERDYADLRLDASGPGSLPATGTDERLKLLAAEHERDLAALLSPDERREVELRQSMTGWNLAVRFAYFNATEAETRAIYDLQKAWDDKYRPASFDAMATQDRAARDAASKQLEADMEAALGAERYAEWRLGWRLDHITLIDAQRRFNLPQATFDAVDRLPVQLSADANRVIDDPALSADEKRATLTRLAADARAQVRTLLGADLGDAYLAASGRMWVGLVEQGMAYTIGGPSGAGTSVRTIGNAPPPFAAPAPAPPPKR